MRAFTYERAKTPQEAAALQAQLAQPAVEKAVSYSRSVYEISTGAAEELNKLFQSKFAELNKPHFVTQDIGGSTRVLQMPGLGGPAAVTALNKLILLH